MSHRFDFAQICLKGSFDQAFAVAGYAGIGNKSAWRQQGIQFLQHRPGSLYRVSLVTAVKRVQQIFILIDQRRLCCRRTGVNTEKSLFLRLANVLSLYLVLIVSCHKRIVIVFIFKQRFDVLGLSHQRRIAVVQPIHNRAK